MKEFSYFKTLFSTHDDNIRQTKKVNLWLEENAKKWFAQFGARYGSQTYVGTPPGLYWHYHRPNLLIFELPGEQFKGGLFYRAIIETYHFAHWKTPAFMAGWDHYKENGTHSKDNPLSQTDFYNWSAWACGYWLALRKHTPEQFLQLFDNQ